MKAKRVPAADIRPAEAPLTAFAPCRTAKRSANSSPASAPATTPTTWASCCVCANADLADRQQRACARR